MDLDDTGLRGVISIAQADAHCGHSTDPETVSLIRCSTPPSSDFSLGRRPDRGSR